MSLLSVCFSTVFSFASTSTKMHIILIEIASLVTQNHSVQPLFKYPVTCSMHLHMTIEFYYLMSRCLTQFIASNIVYLYMVYVN